MSVAAAHLRRLTTAAILIAAASCPPITQGASEVTGPTLDASLTQERDGLLGLVKYLAPGRDSRSPEEIAHRLWDAAWPRFLDMQAGWLRYKPDPGATLFPDASAHKSAAVCIAEPDIGGSMSFFDTGLSAYVSAWGTASRHPSADEAQRAALAECAEAKVKYGHPECVCRIVGGDSGPVGAVPGHWPETVSRLLAEVEDTKRIRFERSSVEFSLAGVTRALAAPPFRFRDRRPATDPVTPTPTSDPLPIFRLRAPTPLVIGYPDSERDYASACHDRVSYALLPVLSEDARAKQAIDRLTRIEPGELYGCYKISVDTIKHPSIDRGGPMEQQCRYIDHVQFQTPPDPAAFPAAWRSTVPVADISEIWVEAVVRVDETGLPLVKRDKVRPLALKTSAGRRMLALEVLAPEPNGGCYVSKPFSGLLFDFRGCKDSTACATKASSAMMHALEERLAAPPFEAYPSTATDMPPGEFRMERVKRPSKVLGGAYYESTTYTVSTWSADDENPFGSLYGRSRFRGLQQPNAGLLFLRLEHIFTISTESRII
jgi:hypothetical protein